jgi:dipeptidyl aminopeptidase/acylaminoacyl peptidase
MSRLSLCHARLRLAGRAVVLISALAAPAAPALAQDMRDVYRRAERFLPAQAATLVRNLTIEPVWIDGTDRFVYRRQLPNQAKEFVRVDPAANTVAPAFDHARLAAALPSAKANALPFERVTLSEKHGTLEFTVAGKPWRCTLADYKCGAGTEKDARELLSPDGKWAAFVRDHNLYVRSAAGHERALTTDGTEEMSYGTSLSGNDVISASRLNRKVVVQAAWSPDSTRILTTLMDQRGVAKQHLVQSVPDGGFAVGAARRPVIHSWRYALAGDPVVPTMTLVAFDVASGRRTDIRTPRLPQLRPVMQSPQSGLFTSRNAFWHPDSKTVFAVETTRDQKTMRLWAASAETGEPRVIVEEHEKAWIESPVPPQVIPSRKQVLWWSQRSGWGHLYVYDVETGKLIRPLTSGDWVVRAILHADASSAIIAASGKESGREPYLRHLYRVDLESGHMTLLTPEDADHEVAAAEATALDRFSPSGAYFVDVYSRVDQPPVAALRARDGRVVRELERADVSEYVKLGYRAPKPFQVLASDGKSPIYGVLMYPTTFDPAKKYPVIDAIYPGPQVIKAPKRYQAGAIEQSIAELGFVVFQIDGLGTPGRSKVFHDAAYADMGNGGDLASHIEGLRQLAKDHPYLDLDRVGIFGHSGGGFASARAILLYPDFFKVAVSSAGNHDQLGYLYSWGEKYQGPPNGANYDQQENARLAANLKGKLLLAYGDMDDNVNPALTIQLIDALTKANKDYDLLVVPNGNHRFSVNPYFNRRRWDYFVRHLLGLEPPHGFELKAVATEP